MSCYSVPSEWYMYYRIKKGRYILWKRNQIYIGIKAEIEADTGDWKHTWNSTALWTGTKLCIRYCRIPTGQSGCIAYPGESSGRNGGIPDSAVTGAWLSRWCVSNGRSVSAAGETDNSGSEIEPYGYGIGKFAEDHSK